MVILIQLKKMILEEADKSNLSREDKQAVKDHVNKDTSGQAKDDMQHKKEDILAHVKGIFSGKKASMDLEQIYSDVTNIFQESGAGPDLKYKLEHYDKAQLTVLITNKTSLSKEEAEPIAEKIVTARDRVIEKAKEVERKVNQKMAEAKDEALMAAEESRKAAATAAWWLVATAIVSGIASAVGGMLALEGWIF